FFSSRRRHTRFSRDWSSDVCSSDLQVKKSDQLSQIFAGDGWINQAIKLRHRSMQATGELATTELGLVNALGCFDRELVSQQLGEMGWVLVVFQGMVNMDGAFCAGFEHIRDRLVTQLLVDEGFDNPVFSRRLRVQLHEWKRERTA